MENATHRNPGRGLLRQPLGKGVDLVIHTRRADQVWETGQHHESSFEGSKCVFNFDARAGKPNVKAILLVSILHRQASQSNLAL